MLVARPPIPMPSIIKGEKLRFLAHDFETYSEIDLKVVGSDAYSRHKSTEVLMCGYKTNDNPVKQWLPVESQDIPAELEDAILDDRVIKTCWNKAFEWGIWANTLDMVTPHHAWRDTMALSLALALPGSLEKAGEVVKLTDDEKKSTEGAALIRTFSKPRKPTKNNPSKRIHWYMEPVKWGRYKAYNIQDVIAEYKILRKLRKFDLPAHEWELWVIDQIINQSGIPFNMNAVDSAIKLYQHLVRNDLQEMREITGLENPNSNQQLLPWLQDNGYRFDDLKKGHVERALEDTKAELTARAAMTEEQVELIGAKALTYSTETYENLRDVLVLRQDVSRASPKKFFAIQRCVDRVNGVLRNTFQFAGAGRTWRWAGRAFQPQNLPRPEKFFKKIIDMVVEHLELLDPDQIELIYAEPMDLIVSCIRAVAQAPEGFLFIDADLNAIENRVLGWIALERKILRVFERGLDPYISFATYMFYDTYENLYREYKELGDDTKRTIAKPAVLGCARPDTLVLTDSGWKAILDVEKDDRVFDGESWVEHDGVVFSGEKDWTAVHGVGLTPDHKVWTGKSWFNAENQNPVFWNQALSTAAGLFLNLLKSGVVLGKSIGAGAPNADVFTSAKNTPFSIRKDRTGAVFLVRERHGVKYETKLVVGSTIEWQTASTPFVPVATIRSVDTSSITAEEELSADSIRSMTSWSTSSEIWARTALSKLIENATTSITSEEIFVSLIEACKTAIDETAIESNTTGDCIQQKNSDDNLRQNIEIKAQSRGKSEKGCPPKISSEDKQSVEGRIVFDIVNAGQNRRYMIWSAEGPLIVHNCGYQLGPGEERYNHKTGETEGTGLLGYAWNMRVKLTKEQAIQSVKVFRETYTEVVKFWYGIERAAKKCLKTGKPVEYNMLRFDYEAPFLRMHLPSGRALHYCRPTLEPVRTPWGEMREQITYEGLNDKNQWGRISTHGGKITENADQAIARDIIAGGMRRAYYRGLDIRIHVHDQIVALAPEDDAEDQLKVLQECMAEEEDWHVWGNYKLPLDSAGFVSKVFRKD